MTIALSDSMPAEPITLTFAVSQAREVAEVLPWVLHALVDRPGLSAKQRRRRQLTTSALNGLLDQLTERLEAHVPPDPQETSA